MKAATHALLWDIDGTLLTTQRAGIIAWEQSVQLATGEPCNLSDLRTAGLTDPEIAKLLAGIYADGRPETACAMLESYEVALPQCLPLRDGEVLPGVLELMDCVTSQPHVVSWLLTGNTRVGARAKLTHFGLDGYFDAGAFGDDGATRADVARKAWHLVQERLGDQASLRRTFVIGDTPSDVECGRAVGALTVGIASGLYSVFDLTTAGAWLALDRIPSPPEFGRLLDLPMTNLSSSGRRAKS